MAGTWHATNRRTAGLSAGRLLLLGAALAGVIAMHGLSDHGAAGRTPMSMTGASAVSAPGSPVPDAHTMADAGQGTYAAGATYEPGDVGSKDGHTPGLMELCLAFFALAMVMLRPRLHRARRLARSGLQTTGMRWRPVAREPAPPALSILSILRC